jgi:hypothetical protein
MSKVTTPIITIRPIMPAGVFNVSVISKMKPISVLPMCCIFRDCYYSAANGTDNDTLGNFKVKVLLLG